MLINGRYLRVKDLVKTAMSEIFFVVDSHSKSNILWLAKKIDLHGGEENLSILTTERDILLKTRHYALPRIYDTFVENGSLYIIRDYINGYTLEEVVIHSGPLPELAVRDYCRQICDVFEKELHRVDTYTNSDFYKPYPIIFQDLKPSNIILDSAGHLYLIDFGIAVSSPLSKPRGKTHGFSAPEQSDLSVNPNETMDIYGFGSTIYYLLTGVIPSYPPNPIKESYPYSAVSDGMLHIIMKCMQHDPGKRYQSFGELSKDLNIIDTYSDNYRRWAEHYEWEYKDASRRRWIRMVISLTLALAFSFMMVTGIIDVIGQREIRLEAWAAEQAQLAYTQSKLLNYGEAIRISEEALIKRPKENITAHFRYIMGVAYFYQNDYPSSVENFEKAVLAEPENNVYRRDYAVSLVKLGRMEDALLQLSSLPADDFNSMYVSAQIYEMIGQTENAAGLYEICLTAEDDELRAYAYVSAARIAYETNRSRGQNAALDAQIAVLEMAEASSISSGRTLILDTLRSLFLEKARMSGEQSEREHYFQLWFDISNEYKKLVAGSLKIYLNTAQICFEMNELDEARQVLDEALFALGESHEVCFLYAIIEATELGRKAKSERDYTQFIRYAVSAVSLAPYENENTKILRNFVKDHGLGWSDPIWEQ